MANLNEMIPFVYDELRRLARYYLNQERTCHTLQPTALVHEAYLRLMKQHNIDWMNRSQFFPLAAQMMRRILIDHAKTRQRGKRGGDAIRLSLDDAIGLSDERAADLLALDEALTELAKIDERKCCVIELRYFGGMSVEETAQILGVSAQTVLRDWHLAKAWLYRQLNAS